MTARRDALLAGVVALLVSATPAVAQHTPAPASPLAVASPSTQTFLCTRRVTMRCDDPAWCEEAFTCTVQVWLDAPDPTRSYVGVSAQIHHGPSPWPEYRNWNLRINQQAERTPVQGYVFGGYDDRNQSHIGGDFGTIITAMNDWRLPGDSAVAGNVFNGAGDPGAWAHGGGTAFTANLGGYDGFHGSVAFSAPTPIERNVRWYRILHVGPDTLHEDTPGGIWFDGSGPRNFITIRPSDDVDDDAIRLINARWTEVTLSLRKSGRVVTASPYGCLWPSYAFQGAEGTGLCLDGQGLGFAHDGAVQLRLGVRGVQIPAAPMGSIYARPACMEPDGTLVRCP
jgi:hypothetical protein